MYFEGRRDYNSSFKFNTQVIEAVSSRRTIIKMDVLRPGTKYSVYVKATTNKGEGVQSGPVVVETPSEGMHVKLVFKYVMYQKYITGSLYLW